MDVVHDAQEGLWPAIGAGTLGFLLVSACAMVTPGFKRPAVSR
jgi:hypothetical protein